MSQLAGASVVAAPGNPAAATPSLPVLCGLALANPQAQHSQDELLDMLGLRDDEFARGIFSRSGVRTRRLDVSRETVAATLQERAADSEERLFEMAVRAVGELDFDPAEIGLVVTASYYSVGGPTLAHRVLEHFGLPPAADKYHLTGVGCASAVPLLRLAGQALRDRAPGERALVVGAESVSGFLSRVRPGDEKAKVVGSALFADGCAAALVALGDGDREPGGVEIAATAVHQVPDTLGHVRFAVSATDSHMMIARELPAIAETGVPPLVDGFLATHGLERSDVDHWLIHPGGRGIIEGLRRGLGLTGEQVAPSVRVLAELGNMGTPSSFFVLEATEEMRRPAPGDRGLMVAIGPGVTVGLMLTNWKQGDDSCR